MRSDALRLNLGAGGAPREGYFNIDRAYDQGHEPQLQHGEVYPLDFPDGSADEVYASHVLEHFSYRETADVLREWIRVLKPGGVLKVAVPDFRWVVDEYLKGDSDAPVHSYLMGAHSNEDDYHKAIFDEEGLKSAFEALGLINVRRWLPEVDDCASLPVSLNIMGVRPAAEATSAPGAEGGASPVPGADGWYDGDLPALEISSVFHSEWTQEGDRSYRYLEVTIDGVSAAFVPQIMTADGRIRTCGAAFDTAEEANRIASEYGRPPTEEEIALAQIKIGHPDPRFAHVVIPRGTVSAVMTCPRLGFTAFMHCALESFAALGIGLQMSGGAFWDQGLERVFETAVADGVKYILACDYDTLFEWRDIQTLYGIMVTRADIDALCPVQMRREMPAPLMTIKGEDGLNRTQIPYETFAADVTPISTGHFGLTIIRAEALADISRPWFHSVPDADGTWGDERQDADIAFWRKFTAAGRSLYQSNRVTVGHIEQMVTWPDRQLLPRFQYCSDYQKNGRPAEAWR